jgi:hypothetical protein
VETDLYALNQVIRSSLLSAAREQLSIMGMHAPPTLLVAAYMHRI